MADALTYEFSHDGILPFWLLWIAAELKPSQACAKNPTRRLYLPLQQCLPRTYQVAQINSYYNYIYFLVFIVRESIIYGCMHYDY